LAKLRLSVKVEPHAWEWGQMRSHKTVRGVVGQIDGEPVDHRRHDVLAAL
jgi:hypothetical protein